MKIKEFFPSGCYKCKWLIWMELDYGEGDSGFICDSRDDEPHIKFKTFPCLRKLKCLEQSKELIKKELDSL